jgi:acetolactate decarboxylase
MGVFLQPEATLFQISTSRSLVAGVYEGAASVADLRRRGNFGLGTFAGLDGEMTILDGIAYQAKGDGTVVKADGTLQTPFAMITNFEPEACTEIRSVRSIDDLITVCDGIRGSNNLFYAFRVDGRFGRLYTRVINRTPPGVALREASGAQTEFDFRDVDGTLVGIWSPQFSASVTVPEYHFHFVSADRSISGHVLECHGSDLKLQSQVLHGFHLELPQSKDYLRADLSEDTTDDLVAVERAH